MVSALRSLCSSRELVNFIWRKSLANVSGSNMCPVCRMPMKVVYIDINGEKIELDVCCRCQTVWFSEEEFAALPLKSIPLKDELPQKAKEILALHNIKNVQEQNIDTDGEPDNPWKFIAGTLGFPIELDAPALRSIPIITWSMALICILTFFINFTDHTDIIKNYGLIPSDLFNRYAVTCLTSIFLHGGVMHLAGNMYCLMIFGDNVEDYLGKWRYLALLVFSGLFSSILYCVLNIDSNIPCVGASGVISGITAAYAVLFPWVNLSFCFRHVCIFNWIKIPAWGAFALWIIFQILMAFVIENKAGSGVAYSAHIGGAICGLIFGMILRISSKFR